MGTVRIIKSMLLHIVGYTVAIKCTLFFILYSPLSIPEIHQGGYRICHDNNKQNTESYMTAQHIHYNSTL